MTDHAWFGPEHARALRTETIVSTAINATVPAAIIWFLEVPPPQVLVGQHDILASIVPASGLATLLMTLILTLIVRRRVASGRLSRLDWPPADRGFYRFVPQHLLLRAIALALAAIVLLVPITVALVALSGILPLTRIGALLFNLGFGMVVGLVMTRFVVVPAMADGGIERC